MKIFFNDDFILVIIFVVVLYYWYQSDSLPKAPKRRGRSSCKIMHKYKMENGNGEYNSHST